MNETLRFNSRDARRRFDRAAATLAGADFAYRSAADGLFERMLPMIVEPRLIIDVGSGLGTASKRLAKQFRSASVVSVDFSSSMLASARSGIRLFSKVREVQADATRLPFKNACADLLFANLLLPWLNDVPAFLAEAQRVLRKDGLLMFSTLGPSSLANVRDAWDSVDNTPHVGTFDDMHNIGDALLRCGLRDPVVDVDYLNISYQDPESLFDDLTATGARNSLAGRRKTLTGTDRFDRFRRTLFARVPLTLELEMVFGHAWGSEARQAPGEFRVAASNIGVRAG